MEPTLFSKVNLQSKVEKTSENESTKYDFVPDIGAKGLNLAASRREHLDCYISCVP